MWAQQAGGQQKTESRGMKQANVASAPVSGGSRCSPWGRCWRDVLLKRASTAEMFEGQHYHHEAQQGRRELRRRHPVAKREPCAVDAGGKGLHPKYATVP